jgi:hypothetical protein
MKTVTKVSLLRVMGFAALGAGIWTCFAVNRWVGYETDWKFMAAVMIPSACFSAALGCVGSAWKLVCDSRRRKAFMRAGAAAGYSPKEITDYFK